MFSTLVSGLGNFVHPIHQALAAIEEASWNRSGPQSTAVSVLCNSVHDLKNSCLHHSQILTAVALNSSQSDAD